MSMKELSKFIYDNGITISNRSGENGGITKKDKIDAVEKFKRDNKNHHWNDDRHNKTITIIFEDGSKTSVKVRPTTTLNVIHKVCCEKYGANPQNYYLSVSKFADGVNNPVYVMDIACDILRIKRIQ